MYLLLWIYIQKNTSLLGLLAKIKCSTWGFPGGATACPRRRHEMQVPSLGWEDPLEEGTTTHSSTLAWRILWPEEPGRLQSTESQRAGHD